MRAKKLETPTVKWLLAINQYLIYEVMSLLKPGEINLVAQVRELKKKTLTPYFVDEEIGA